MKKAILLHPAGGTISAGARDTSEPQSRKRGNPRGLKFCLWGFALSRRKHTHSLQVVPGALVLLILGGAVAPCSPTRLSTRGDVPRE